MDRLVINTVGPSVRKCNKRFAHSFIHSCKQVVFLSQSSCVLPVELTDGRGERGCARSQIIRPRESLPFLKSIQYSLLCEVRNAIRNNFASYSTAVFLTEHRPLLFYLSLNPFLLAELHLHLHASLSATVVCVSPFFRSWLALTGDSLNNIL